MPVRLRKPTAPPLPDPPIARETLRALIGRNPSFMVDQQVTLPVEDWSALDELMAKVAEEVAA